MNTELTKKIEEVAYKAGADLVGFASVDRFADGMPSRIFSGAKSVIGIAFRVLRGSLRGIEDGTTYYQYTTTGVEALEETLMPTALLRVSAALEDEGYLGIPQRRNQQLKGSSDAVNPEMLHHTFYPGGAKELQLDFTEAAIACGLGERGLSGSLLTDAFGPLQRMVFVITDAELEPTPLVAPHICDNCGACVSACPGHAISETGELDSWQCAAYYRGASRKTNPYMPPDAYADLPNRREIMEGVASLSPEEAKEVMARTYFYPPIKHGYVSSICGRACDRACYAHLEESGKLTKTFHLKFRRRPVWELSVDEPEEK